MFEIDSPLGEYASLYIFSSAKCSNEDNVFQLYGKAEVVPFSLKRKLIVQTVRFSQIRKTVHAIE